MPELLKTCSAFLVALGALTAFACNRGSSPTEPKASLHLVVTGSMANAGSGYQQTITQMQLRVDGTVVRDFSSSPPAHDIILSATTDCDRGQHSLEVRVVGQTKSPAAYTVGGTVDAIDDSGRTVKSIRFPDKDASLATNQGVSWSFSL